MCWYLFSPVYPVQFLAFLQFRILLFPTRRRWGSLQRRSLVTCTLMELKGSKWNRTQDWNTPTIRISSINITKQYRPLPDVPIPPRGAGGGGPKCPSCGPSYLFLLGWVGRRLGLFPYLPHLGGMGRADLLHTWPREGGCPLLSSIDRQTWLIALPSQLLHMGWINTAIKFDHLIALFWWCWEMIVRESDCNLMGFSLNRPELS